MSIIVNPGEGLSHLVFEDVEADHVVEPADEGTVLRCKDLGEEGEAPKLLTITLPKESTFPTGGRVGVLHYTSPEALGGKSRVIPGEDVDIFLPEEPAALANLTSKGPYALLFLLKMGPDEWLAEPVSFSFTEV